MQKFVIGALACALSVSACAKVGDAPVGTTTTTRSQGTISGQLRVAIQRSPNTLNPLLSANTTEGFLNRLTFDTLVSVDGSGKNTIPILATEVPTEKNGGISKDGLAITYHLHSGVKWHDGAPFTSKDVKFSWQAMMNDANNVNERVGYEDVKSVDTPNDLTVVFHLKRKFAPFVNTVFGESDSPVAIVPEHLLAKYKDLNRIPFNQEPVGTGPFKVARWVRGDHIELVANDDYFRGKPKLRTIIVREIPDENTSVNALRSHDVDWIFEASEQHYSVLKTIPDINVVLNEKPQTLQMLVNTSRPNLGDVRVRRAISYAVDKPALVEKNTFGTATVAWADQPPFQWSYTSDVAKYPTSAQKAKALLAEAGFTPGPDGIMRKNGQPLTVVLSYNVENTTRRNVAVQVQAMLRAVGIDAQMKTYPANILFATYGQGGVLTNGRYDLNISGWIAGQDPDDHSEFGCDQIPRPGHPDGVNYTRYCSKAMDALQASALASYDEAVRKPAYVKIQQLLAADLPIVYIWFPRMLQPISRDFKGFAPNPVNEAWNAYEWNI
ncbi:MAG: putative Extracellular solute-binding proteinfamily 5 [Candidatus Eremiobacteraeota bacterium]|nr:putative Extracellular solute-binding proteinfamily 5 [Candidatus Eremiobacteraeota bacterium]